MSQRQDLVDGVHLQSLRYEDVLRYYLNNTPVSSIFRSSQVYGTTRALRSTHSKPENYSPGEISLPHTYIYDIMYGVHVLFSLEQGTGNLSKINSYVESG
jgi:hypothetical protein